MPNKLKHIQETLAALQAHPQASLPIIQEQISALVELSREIAELADEAMTSTKDGEEGEEGSQEEDSGERSLAVTSGTESETETETEDVVKGAIAVPHALFMHIIKRRPSQLISDKLPQEGPAELICDVLPNQKIQCTLSAVEHLYIADLRNRGESLPDELRKELWPRRRRLFGATMSDLVLPGPDVFQEEAVYKAEQFDEAQLPLYTKVYTLSLALDSVANKLVDQAKRFMSLPAASLDILTAITTLGAAIASAYKAAMAALGASIKEEEVSDKNPFAIADKLRGLLVKALPSLPEKSHIRALTDDALKQLAALIALEDDFTNLKVASVDQANDEVLKAQAPEGALPVLKVPDPEFNIERLKADKSSGILSRQARASRAGKQHFLINELKPTEQPAAFIWGVVLLEPAVEYASMGELPKDILEGLDQFTREEFSTEGPIFYLPFKLIAVYDPPLELKHPPQSRRYGPLIEIPAALKSFVAKSTDSAPSYCPNCSGDPDSVQFCLACGAALVPDDSVSLAKAGPSSRYAPMRPGVAPDLSPVSLDEVLDNFHEEFMIRAPFIYLVGSTANNGATEHDIDLLIRGPLDSQTEHAVKTRLGRMLPGELSKRVQFIGSEEMAGPYSAHTALYDLVVRRRHDYRTVIEMAAPRTDVSKQNPFLDLPSKGDVRYPSVLQAHFRGRTVHGDFRIKVDDHLIGYTLTFQKATKVPDVKTLAQAKHVAEDFDLRGSWWNKAMNAPSRVSVVTKTPHPVSWEEIDAEEFDPGLVGATRFKPGFIVAMARPDVTFGSRTPVFHEYFLEHDPKFQGLLVFRLVIADGADAAALESGTHSPAGTPFWTGMFTKDLLPSVLKRRAVEVKRIPPKGFAWLPLGIKEAVPRQYRYWLADTEKERLEIRDALVKEKIFTSESIRLVDGEFKQTVTKRYVFGEKDPDKQEAPISQLFAVQKDLQASAKEITLLFPKHATYCEPFFDMNGGVFLSTKATKAHTMLNVGSTKLADALVALTSADNAQTVAQIKKGSWIGSSDVFALASAGLLPEPYGTLYSKSFQDPEVLAPAFDESLAGFYADLPNRLEPALSTLKKAEVLSCPPHEFLDEVLAKHDTVSTFIFMTPKEQKQLRLILPRLAAVKAAQYMLLTTEPVEGLSEALVRLTIQASDGTARYHIAANFSPHAAGDADYTVPARSLFYSLPSLIEKASAAPFTLTYQWWKGQTVVRHGPSSSVYHLFIQRSEGVDDFQLQQDPTTVESAAAVYRHIKISDPQELMSLEGDIPPNKKYGDTVLNTTKNTPSTMQILSKGSISFLEDSPLFKKFSFKGESLPKNLEGYFTLSAEEGSTEIFFLERTEGRAGEVIKEVNHPPSACHHTSESQKEQEIFKKEVYKPLTLDDGSKIPDAQIWDPSAMSSEDDKTNDRFRLRPPALFKPMKPANRESNTFRSNEVSRLLEDFATSAVLKTGLSIEPKYNGWRTVLEKTEDGRIFIFSEDIFSAKGRPINYAQRWPSVKAELERIDGPFIIDGEFTAVDDEGNPVPRRELAAFRGKNANDDKGVRIKVFDAYYTSKAGNVMGRPYAQRRKDLAELLKDAGTHITLAPFKIVYNKKELVAALKWARRIPNSEGAMLKALQHTATLNENDLIAKFKAIREIRGIIYEKQQVKDSPGVFNYFYAVGPISNPAEWSRTVTVNGLQYVPMGKTFNVKLAGKVGDVIRIEVTEILYDKSEKAGAALHGFTPVVIEITSDAPSTVDDVLNMLELGEVKKSTGAVKQAVGNALALSDLELVVLEKQKEERFIKGVVLIPGEPDAHGDIYDEETVRNACHYFMEHSEALGKQHMTPLSKFKLRILECYLADSDCEIGSRRIKRGTWLMAARVLDDRLWADIKSGAFTGWSIQGSAIAEMLV